MLLTGSELAVGAFVHPVLSKLQDAAHAEAAKPLARLLGKVMPFWYAAALLLAIVSLLTYGVGTRFLVGVLIVRDFACRYCTILAYLFGPN